MSSGVDVMQVFISASAVFGIGLLWVTFTEKAYKTSCDLWNAAFYLRKKKDRSDEEK